MDDDRPAAVAEPSDDAASLLTRLLAHLPAELHEQAAFTVGGVAVAVEADGARLSVPSKGQWTPDSRRWLSRDHCADLAALLGACHAALGGAASAREVSAAVMKDVMCRLAVPAADAAGLCVGGVMVARHPDGAVLAVARTDNDTRAPAAALDLGELAQLAGLLRAYAGLAPADGHAFHP